MDDCCAVCADPLEWVAYGLCGHREVCSTCVVRLLFVMEDKQCCICKIPSPVVFVTKVLYFMKTILFLVPLFLLLRLSDYIFIRSRKYMYCFKRAVEELTTPNFRFYDALGDYTKVISDFTVLPSGAEGQVGSFWYHEDTQAYFDDVDHYKMIKAMCRLSCSICDKSTSESQGSAPSNKKEKFRNVNQLKRHLFHRHKTFMCDLCLEGRKVFICEQRLHSRAQLNRHMNTGDSEVDGSESERGGFSGHPICDFCRKRFYGENELYLHMSREHYTCHICQRRNPGQYDYFKDYNDLEVHFRQEHFLCEDEACLEKKFVVFPTEAEMKRHNTVQHGGHMSRSKRNAALQIPVSFRYRRSSEHDSRRGRGRGHDSETSEHQLSVAIQASIETANMEQTQNGSSGIQSGPSFNDGIDIDSFTDPFEALSTSSQQVSSRYLEALSQRSRNTSLGESSFPPLLAAQGNDDQSSTDQREPIQGSMAARLRAINKGTVNILHSARPRMPKSSSSSVVVDSTQRRIPLNQVIGQSSNSPSSWETSNKNNTSSQSISKFNRSNDNSQARGISPNHGTGLSSGSVSMPEPSSSNKNDSQAPQPDLRERMSGKRPVSTSSVSASVPDQGVSLGSISRFPDVPVIAVEDIQAANKSLVEKIQSGLNFNEEKYASFKEISAQYRQGQVDAKAYLMHVQQFGLSHLVHDLAQLCPDSNKRTELLDAFDASIKANGTLPGDVREVAKPGSAIKTTWKGKAKVADNVVSSSSKASEADNVMEAVRKLQAANKPWEVEVEELSKDGYRSMKGKAIVLPEEDRIQLSTTSRTMSYGSTGQSHSLGGGRWSCVACTLINEAATSKCAACGMGRGGSGSNAGGGDATNKMKKKTSKFHRVRLGDGSAAALLDLHTLAEVNPKHQPDAMSDKGGGKNLPVRGVWRDGGGKKLMAMTLKQPSK